MKILNLFAGIGGNRTLWGNEHEITAIESNQQIAYIYKKRFPKDTVIIGDAMKYNLNNYDKYDFIWASPPCQTHSWLNFTNHKLGARCYPNMELWQLIIYLKGFVNSEREDRYWIVENVRPWYMGIKNKKRQTIIIKQDFILGRHYYWSNIIIPKNTFKYSNTSITNAKEKVGRPIIKHIEELEKLHEIKLDHELRSLIPDNLYIKSLRNCVNPKEAKFILDYVINKKQQTLESYII